MSKKIYEIAFWIEYNEINSSIDSYNSTKFKNSPLPIFIVLDGFSIETLYPFNLT